MLDRLKKAFFIQLISVKCVKFYFQDEKKSLLMVKTIKYVKALKHAVICTFKIISIKGASFVCVNLKLSLFFVSGKIIFLFVK